MSDNTYLKIIQDMPDNFVVTHRDADDGEILELIGQYDTLDEAVRMANEWDYGVEYGLSIELKEETRV